MEKSSDKYIDHKAYIRYLRKVTGEQVDIKKVHLEVMAEVMKKMNQDSR